MGVNPLSIADVVSSQVPLDWTEAVAIIGELCAVVMTVDIAATRIPDAADVVLMPDGTLAIGRGAQQHDITYGARLLHALLAASTTPAPLRLFVSRAISSSQHGSVVEFADALAYYERPGRPMLLQKVFERCVSAPRNTSEGSILLPSEPVAPPSVRLRQRIPRRTLMTAGSIAALVLAVTAIWGSGVRLSPASIGLGNLFGEAGSAISSVTDRLRRDLGLPGAGVETAADNSAALSTPGPAAPPRARRMNSTVAPPIPEFPDVNLPTQNNAPAAVATAVTETAAAGATDAATAVTAAASELEDPAIYSSDARDVTPAILEDEGRAQLATTPEPAPTMNRIEVTVDQKGEVRRVVLVKGPATMNDVMLLSAVKAWRFRPAQRNGHPVNYRMVLDWPAPQAR